ncbi:flagellar protein FlgN [Paenibacillus azoreducens]|uniref:Flagellar protein FlgN n=1 Tax=Paenibacillus azoreducens TaxID=116718 RepID=A0A920CTZ4_9BACL|nr:flagellar protein FlgN [Paenibacillus azoreducens]GIO48897.1 hypothetical protein J34TS1_36620 [Paenibacillus azoreducens]
MSSIELLITVLENLDVQHQQMLEIAKSKKNAIIGNDIDTLVKLMNQETKGLKQIELLESKRAEIAQQYLHERGIKSQLNLNITELIRLVFDVEDKKRLQSVQKQLSDTLHSLKQANDLNQKLIEQALSFIDYSLNLLVDTPYQEVTYQNPLTDGTGGKSQSGYFDSKA